MYIKLHISETTNISFKTVNIVRVVIKIIFIHIKYLLLAVLQYHEKKIKELK